MVTGAPLLNSLVGVQRRGSGVAFWDASSSCPRAPSSQPFRTGVRTQNRHYVYAQWLRAADAGNGA